MAPQTAKRRIVRFDSFEDYLAELERVAGENYQPVGKLSKGQIFKHLADSFTSSIDGFPEGLQGPWIIRKIIGPMLKNRILRTAMKPGINLPKKASDYHPDRQDFSPDESLKELLEALKRYQSEGGKVEHPYIGKLTPQEWDLLHLRHGELHLGFLVFEE